jgi:hypothetical protein
MRAKGTLATYQAMSPGDRWKFFDPAETPPSTSKVDSGPMVEVASAPLVQQLLAEDTAGNSLTCLENVYLQAVDSSGADVGGAQHEIDFVMLGASSVVKIISAKLSPKQLKGMQAKAVSQLETYRDVPLPPTATDLRARFGGGPTTWASAGDLDVRWNGGTMRLSQFRGQYLTSPSSTPVTSVVVEGVTVGPDLGRAEVFHLAIDRNKLMEIMSMFVDAAIGGATTRPTVTT